MLAIVAAASAISLAGAAQPAAAEEDWDRIVDGDAIAAFVEYDNGLGVAVRCTGGVLHALILGLPPSSGIMRTLTTSLGGSIPWTHDWYTGDGPTFSPLPSLEARRWREGGEFRIEAADSTADGGKRVYEIDLPPSPSAINEVLSACGRPHADPHDAERAALPVSGLPAPLEWARRPPVQFPTGRTYTRGYANVVCLTDQSGGLTDCRVETELPADGGFGEQALRGMSHGRVRAPAGADVGGRQISVRFNFVVEDDDLPAVGRLRPRSRTN